MFPDFLSERTLCESVWNDVTAGKIDRNGGKWRQIRICRNTYIARIHASLENGGERGKVGERDAFGREATNTRLQL